MWCWHVHKPQTQLNTQPCWRRQWHMYLAGMRRTSRCVDSSEAFSQSYRSSGIICGYHALSLMVYGCYFSARGWGVGAK